MMWWLHGKGEGREGGNSILCKLELSNFKLRVVVPTSEQVVPALPEVSRAVETFWMYFQLETVLFQREVEVLSSKSISSLGYFQNSWIITRTFQVRPDHSKLKWSILKTTSSASETFCPPVVHLWMSLNVIECHILTIIECLHYSWLALVVGQDDIPSPFGT